MTSEPWRHWRMLFFSGGSRPRLLFSNTRITVHR